MPRFVVTTAAAAALAMSSVAAAAQDWPSRVVRVIVPAAPGGSSDAAARLVTNHFQSVFRQPFIVENKPGNGNATGAAFVAQAAPDGYTLLVSNSASNLTVPLVARNAGYDPVADFTHIVMLTSSPYVFAVYPDLVLTSWFGLSGPKNLDPRIVSRINREARAFLKEPQMRKLAEIDASDPLDADAAGFANYVAAEVARWGAVVRALDIKVEE